MDKKFKEEGLTVWIVEGQNAFVLEHGKLQIFAGKFGQRSFVGFVHEHRAQQRARQKVQKEVDENGLPVTCLLEETATSELTKLGHKTSCLTRQILFSDWIDGWLLPNQFLIVFWFNIPIEENAVCMAVLACRKLKLLSNLNRYFLRLNSKFIK